MDTRKYMVLLKNEFKTRDVNDIRYDKDSGNYDVLFNKAKTKYSYKKSIET